MSPTDRSDIDWTTVRALSFDIYGTLIDWQDGIIDAALSTAMGPHLSQDRAELYEQLRSYDRAIEKEHPKFKKSEVNAEVLRRFASDLRLVEEGNVTQDEVERSAKEYGGAIGGFPAFPDTANAIRQLAKHYHLILLSNIDHASFDQTLSGPLKDISFTKSCIAEDIGSYKPDLMNFEYLLSHLKSDLRIEKTELVHVAQSLYHDHAPCKDMGIRSIWVDRYGILAESVGGEGKGEEELKKECGFVLRVESLGELADLVEEAFERKERERVL